MDTKVLPKLSIITVSFNSEAFIETTIKSVVSQTYSNIEYILIDGSSTDKTVEIIKRYEDNIFSWVSEQDKSMYDAINKGLSKCTGEYIWILNSDDYLPHIHTVTDIMKIITKQPNKLGFYGNTFISDSKKIKLRRTFQVNRKELLLSKHCSFIPHPALIVSSDSLKNLPKYDIGFKYASDYDYILNLLKIGELKFINLPFSVFRRHPDSITSSGKIDSERLEILHKHLYFRYSKLERYFYFVSRWFWYKIINLF
ncbi:glycosyltransferase family 2 protein [Dyadobacter frigoris]|uniref:Glycosyltransferase n=1 Tax=Dyadobacter frigoris TaxID=2576211 RepID=A0A4U6D9G7_9BACT|nr:glycosyltransferase family 2 protein [Dyadobacter frigoris]TKT93285.1 glycosyltransferase [Dyadobacter frigoris]